jgi:hypothetical protein
MGQRSTVFSTFRDRKLRSPLISGNLNDMKAHHRMTIFLVFLLIASSTFITIALRRGIR